MDLTLLIILLFGFVLGFLLSILLLFIEASSLFTKRYGRFWFLNKERRFWFIDKKVRFWEKLVYFLFTICQAGLSIAGIIATLITLTTDNEPYWLDTVILCTIQLFVGNNLSRTVSAFDQYHCAVWLAYACILWTAPDIAFYTSGGLAHDYELFCRGAIASAVPLLLWGRRRLSSKYANGRNTFIHLQQIALMITNAVATLIQIIGAIAIYILLLTRQERIEFRQSIFVACLLVQVVNLCVGFLFYAYEKIVIKRYNGSNQPRDDDDGGTVVRLSSIPED